MLAINTRATENHQSEQKGFANLVRGTSVCSEILRRMRRAFLDNDKEDAKDLLTIVSLIQRRLDTAHRPPRP